MQAPLRGEVWLINLDLVRGHEGRLGLDDVTPDLVSVATSTTRTFAQLCWRGRNHLFQHIPRCTQERYIALRGRRIDGSGFCRSQSRRDSPGSVGIPLETVNHHEIARWLLLPAPREAGVHCRQLERLERAALVAADPSSDGEERHEAEQRRTNPLAPAHVAPWTIRAVTNSVIR